jgi:UTP:GlnB (protein PII) uridylyltransferase
VQRRRVAAARVVGPARGPAARIATAPPGYLLAHDSSDIARHVHLLSPLPAPGQVRAVVTPGRVPGHWHLDIASRDQPGLLAAFTGVLNRLAVDIAQAVLATWDDGAALQAFVIRTTRPPEPVFLRHALESSLDAPLSSPPIPDAHVTFDATASALYTRCDVHAADQPGLLHAIAVAIATAHANVHAASVTTTVGVSHDRFDLSNRAGHKLDPTLENTIRAGVHTGTTNHRPAKRPN